MNRREKFENLKGIINSLGRKIDSKISEDKWYYDKKEYYDLENDVKSLREISALLKTSDDYAVDINDDIEFFSNTVKFCDDIFDKIVLKEPNEFTIRLLKFIEQTNKNFEFFKSNLIHLKKKMRRFKSTSKEEDFSNIWGVIDLINNKSLSEEQINNLNKLCFDKISSEFVELRNDIFETIRFDGMDMRDEGYYKKKISSFIFEGKDIVEKNMQRDPDELREYIMLSIPMKFNVEGFLFGLEISSFIKEMSDNKGLNNINKEEVEYILALLS